ncbi:WbqC family protein [uncultured Tateyamaria sp.]|uniref:WbqC family protein n=1 Tax=Tateyamaria sp. 1078 TaxID=3417464 RepID=UPI002638C8AB|nr:WbqC family protein [uncultured Tateyamaria sp.]
MSVKTIAIMQPYFFPYLGYLGLMAHADEFVVLDCVQFPRRGRVHRCQVPGPHASERWLTLPVAHAPQSARICDMQFQSDAARRWQTRLTLHPWAQNGTGSAWTETLLDLLVIRGASLGDYLLEQLVFLRDALGLNCAITRSSDLGIDPAKRGSERLAAIAGARGAARYVNAPGGRSLYCADQFAQHGLDLAFLPDYTGPFRHLLPALMRDDIGHMTQDLARYAAEPLVKAEGANA